MLLVSIINKTDLNTLYWHISFLNPSFRACPALHTFRRINPTYIANAILWTTSNILRDISNI